MRLSEISCLYKWSLFRTVPVRFPWYVSNMSIELSLWQFCKRLLSTCVDRSVYHGHHPFYLGSHMWIWAPPPFPTLRWEEDSSREGGIMHDHVKLFVITLFVTMNVNPRKLLLMSTVTSGGRLVRDALTLGATLTGSLCLMYNFV